MIVRGPLPDLAVPDVPFSHFLLEKGWAAPDKIALVELATQAQWTYRELIQRAEATAAGLAAGGLAQGQVVAICGFNQAEYALAALAVWLAGAVVATVNPLFTAGEMAQELDDCRASWLIATPEVMDRARETAQRCHIEHLLAFGSLPRGQGHALPRLHVKPDDTALILYSSGTTGLPKGVLLTHRNLIAATYQLEAGDTAREDDVLMAIPPFFHVVGLHGILNVGLHAGSTIVIMRRFDLRQFLEATERYRVTRAFFNPPIMLELAYNPILDQYDLSSLKSLLCAAAPLSPEIERAVGQRIGCIVKQGFGMTETTGPITNSPNERELIRLGSVGQPAPGTACKIIDVASGAELDSNQSGEILVRGPQVMKGYLGNPEATARTLEPDGWLHTGDIGYADEDGFLYVVDHLKELIKYKAYQVAPAELEAVLLEHPAVADAAVIPSPDEQAGEVPKAFIVPAAEVAADELIAFVAARVAPYKKVRRVEFVDAIPKSASGKILRRVLVERERCSASTGVSRPS